MRVARRKSQLCTLSLMKENPEGFTATKDEE